MGSRNNSTSTTIRTNVAAATSLKPIRLVQVAASPRASSRWLVELRNLLQQLTQLPTATAALSPGGIRMSRSRVMRIDTLESRELFAVLSGLVFEDVNGDNRYDPTSESPAAHQWVFLDQNGNNLLDEHEPSVMSDASGLAEFHLDFGSWGTILPVPRLAGMLPATTFGSTNSSSSYPLLSVAAFDTVFRGEDSFDPSARLLGGMTDWLLIPAYSEGEGDEGEGDIIGDGLTVITKALEENSTSSTEVGEILLYNQTPPEGWVWFVSDERFEVVGNKIYTKADSPVDYELEQEIVMVVEGFDNSVPNPASASSQKATITLTVLDQNDPPTGIYLRGTSVLERVAGAHIGPVQIVDQDSGEPFAYSVSDQRFEIVGGVLKLRADVALLRETEPFIDLVISARSLLDPAHYVEASAQIEVLANPTPWTNSVKPLDVNNDGVITSIDALIIINMLNASGGSLLLPAVASPRGPRSMPDYVDVNGDGFVGAMDALIVINQLRRDNAMSSSGGGNNGGSTGSGN